MASENDVLWLKRYSAGWLDGAPVTDPGIQDLGFETSVSATTGPPSRKQKKFPGVETCLGSYYRQLTRASAYLQGASEACSLYKGETRNFGPHCQCRRRALISGARLMLPLPGTLYISKR